MEAYLIPLVMLLAGALGAMVMREMGRSDGVGIRAGKSSEVIASHTQSIASLHEHVARIDSTHAAHVAVHNTAVEALNTRLEANRAMLASFNDQYMNALSNVSTAIARLEATVDSLRTTMEGMIQVEREASRRPSLVEQIKDLGELQRMLRAGVGP